MPVKNSLEYWYRPYLPEWWLAIWLCGIKPPVTGKGINQHVYTNISLNILCSGCSPHGFNMICQLITATFNPIWILMLNYRIHATSLLHVRDELWKTAPQTFLQQHDTFFFLPVVPHPRSPPNARVLGHLWPPDSHWHVVSASGCYHSDCTPKGWRGWRGFSSGQMVGGLRYYQPY